MWYEKLGIISIGAQSCGRDDGGLGQMKMDLWKLLKFRCKQSHCPAVDHYALALRIGGEFGEFGEEGITAIRRHNRERYIGADIVIPSSAWQKKTGNQTRDYLASQIRLALRLCLSRLQKDKESVDETSFLNELDNAIQEFEKIDYD